MYRLVRKRWWFAGSGSEYNYGIRGFCGEHTCVLVAVCKIDSEEATLYMYMYFIGAKPSHEFRIVFRAV